jgi:hypothetical protein
LCGVPDWPLSVVKFANLNSVHPKAAPCDSRDIRLQFCSEHEACLETALV